MSTKRKNRHPAKSSLQRAIDVSRKSGGVLRTVDVLRAGVHQRILYAMRKAGTVVAHGRNCVPRGERTR